MKRMKVAAYHKGLLFKNKRYIKMLSEGKYWLKSSEELVCFDMTKPFTPAIDLNILLQDTELASQLEVIEVGNGQLACLYENKIFKSVLTAGKYAFWKGIIQYDHQLLDIAQVDVSGLERTILAKQEVAQHLRTYNVESYEKGLLYVEGKFSRMLEPGLHYFWKNALTVTVYKADMRQQQMEMNGQEMLTKDKANLRINFALQYRITDIHKAVENKEYDKQLYMLVQLALREQIALYTLDELLEKRNAIAPAVMENVATAAAEMGVTLTGCGIRDIILPGDVKEIMNQVLIAEKKAQANIIMRREETASTRSLLNTAKLMEENEMLFKLKEMEYVEKIADKISNISVSGGGDIVGQLKQLFMPAKTGK